MGDRAHEVPIPVIPAPIRQQVRDAIERAWAAAVESGALPGLAPEDRPTIEVERPVVRSTRVRI